MAAVRATLAAMEAEDVPSRARHAGARLRAGLEALPGVASVRGEGLLVAAVLTDDVAVAACREALGRGLVINAPRPDVLRFAPSLLVDDPAIDRAVAVVGAVLEQKAVAPDGD
jgi:acetylornithine/succinyldiaminopimelate/putrescine aminotransferase